MCRPDLTLETKNDDLGGVTGFGMKCQSKYWDQLLVWVSDWENYNFEERV